MSRCRCGQTFYDPESYRDHLPCPGTPVEQAEAECTERVTRELRADLALALAGGDLARVDATATMEELIAGVAALRRERDEARAEIERLRAEVAAEHAAKIRAIDEALTWENRARAEIDNSERLARRLTDERHVADARAEEAHRALDAAHTPRERDGQALTLAERIAAAPPPLPEPAGEWRRAGVRRPWWGRVLVGHAEATGAVSPGLRVRVFVDGDAWSIDLDGRTYDRAAAQDLLVGLRLALGPAGIPPTDGQ